MALLPVEEARARILDGVTPTDTESVALSSARGRVLAEDIGSRINQPPFAASAMDGYAVRAEDVGTAPANLNVIGEAPAGQAFDGTVGPGEAVRIFTGAPVPDGADTIVIQENTDTVGAQVTVLQAANPSQFVRPLGLDFKNGEILLRAGTRLGSREIALAAAMNHPALPVRRKPRVAILATGDELIAPGGTPRPDQIISSNNLGMAAFAAQAGAEPVDLGIAADTTEALIQGIGRGADADVLVTLGGASVGDHDLVQHALDSLGMTLDFWKIAMRPGKPLMFGTLGDTRVLGLPGNPVSTFVCARIFLRPLLDTLLGATPKEPTERALLGADMAENDERQDYMRATMRRGDDGSIIATPYPKQDSSMLRTLAEANCFIIRPPFDRARREGEAIDILLFDF